MELWFGLRAQRSRITPTGSEEPGVQTQDRPFNTAGIPPVTPRPGAPIPRPQLRERELRNLANLVLGHVLGEGLGRLEASGPERKVNQKLPPSSGSCRPLPRIEGKLMLNHVHASHQPEQQAENSAKLELAQPRAPARYHRIGCKGEGHHNSQDQTRLTSQSFQPLPVRHSPRKLESLESMQKNNVSPDRCFLSGPGPL